jgi:predicted ester cyclase
MTDRDELLDFYAGYLQACNRHAWEELKPRLADTMFVNGESISRDQYVVDLAAFRDVFPDYQWRLRRAVVESPWLAVHLETSGTRQREFLGAPGEGTPVSSDEFVMYRIERLTIVELWGTADNARLAKSFS